METNLGLGKKIFLKYHKDGLFVIRYESLGMSRDMLEEKN